MVVRHEELFEIGIKALEIVGIPEDGARITVDVLLWADLRGFVLPMGLYKGYGLARGKYDYDIPKLECSNYQYRTRGTILDHGS